MLENQNASEYCLPNSKFYSTPMKRRNKPQPMKPLFATFFWFCLIMFPILSFLYKTFISSLTGKCILIERKKSKKKIIFFYLGCLLVTLGIAIMNIGVGFMLETFHKKPSSYGLKKSNWNWNKKKKLQFSLPTRRFFQI